MKKENKKPKNKKRRRIIAGCLAGILLITGVAAAVFLHRDPDYYLSVQKAASASTPAATGSFIQPWYCAEWSEAEFAAHFEQLQAIGADTLILQWTADTPEGKIGSIYYDTALPKEYFGEDAAIYPDMLENCLAAAEKAGIKVFVGLNLADEWWDFKVRDADWRDSQNTASAAIAGEIYTLYKEKYPTAFHGWYWAWELTNGFFGADSAAELLNRDIGALNALNPEMPLLLSPFNSKNSTYKIAEWEWKSFFKKVHFRKGDIFCLQDAIGAGWIELEDLDYYYAAVKRAVETKPELTFWANCENFTSDYCPADIDRFKTQLDTAALYTDGIVSFSLSHYYLNPSFGTEAFEGYKEMLAGKSGL